MLIIFQNIKEKIQNVLDISPLFCYCISAAATIKLRRQKTRYPIRVESAERYK